MGRLWEVLKSYIETGNETRKVDLKQSLDLSKPTGRTEFAKDVTAMANTGCGAGYLIIGVKDQRKRTVDDPADYIVGFAPDNFHVFEQRMAQALSNSCNPVPEVRYEEITHPTTSRRIGVIVIPRSFNRPYKADGRVFIRRGTHTARTTEEEVKQTDRRILINFARPVEDYQIAKLEELLRAKVDEVIDVLGVLDDKQPVLPQVRRMFDLIGLTPSEWQSLPIVINIHPLAPAASVVLAWIHGLRGFFPEVVRMARDEQNSRFEVVELLQLQSVRNEIRDWAGQYG
jgi:hypothetical protein